MVVLLNHLGIELHKTINTNYSRAQGKEGWKDGEVGTNSYYFSFQLQISSFLEQEADSRIWRMDSVLCITSEGVLCLCMAQESVQSFEIMYIGRNKCLIYWCVNCFKLSKAD